MGQPETLNWSKLLDPDYVPILLEESSNAGAESDLHPAVAGAGVGAVAAVPGMLILIAHCSPAMLSDSALVWCALAAPLAGGAAGASVGGLLRLLWNLICSQGLRT